MTLLWRSRVFQERVDTEYDWRTPQCVDPLLLMPKAWLLATSVSQTSQ